MLKPIKIGVNTISTDSSPFVIAEISANHNGSIERAMETIKAAKLCGVHAVKIQTYTPDTMTINCNHADFKIQKGIWKGRTLYELYGEAFTPYDWHTKLFNYAKKVGVTIFSSPFDESAVDLLEELNTPAYKIASFEITDLPLLTYVASKKKPMLICTGMATFEEIGEALETAKVGGCNELAIFHCVSSYPTPLSAANLSKINLLKKEFSVHVGLSDHTRGTTAGVAATALGATLIEKHFTISRAQGGVDSSFSLEPDEMRELVIKTDETYHALGVNNFSRPKLEQENKIFRRSLYFVEALKAGDVITENHVRRIRPGFGLKPKYYEQILGKKVSRDVEKGERVSLEHLEDKLFEEVRRLNIDS